MHGVNARQLPAHRAQGLCLSSLVHTQDLASWTRDGIAGLQSVVLYSLPELDGAIDTVPLGGLQGNAIYLVPERVKRLTARLRKWVTLRRTPTHVGNCSWRHRTSRLRCCNLVYPLCSRDGQEICITSCSSR